MAVSQAEEILRTLTYNYTATTGSATYTPTTGIIVGPSATSNIKDKITSSFDINCNSYKKNITSNGHYTLTFIPGGTSATRTLSINLKMSRTPSNLVLANVTFSFINLSPGKYYTLTFDVDGINTVFVHPRLYNMTLVLGSTSYTYDNVFGPIATCSDIFAATGVDQYEHAASPTEKVVYAASNTTTQPIKNDRETY